MADDSYVLFSTNLGNFVVELYNNLTPQTVANFLSYVENPTVGDNYTDNFFHRLVSGFVLQGGGYYIQNGTVGEVATGSAIPSEASASAPNVAGSIAMALSTGPNSATDEFFFNLGDNSSLLDGTSDGGPFTVFGQVVENWSVVQTIAASPTVDAGGAFSALPVQGTVPSTGATTANAIDYSVSLVTPFTGLQSGLTLYDDQQDTPFSTVALQDPGNPTGSGDSIAITIENASGTATSSFGTLSLAASAGLTLTATGAGTYVLGTASSITSLQTALDDLVFTPTQLAGTSSSASVTFALALETPGGTLDNSDTTLTISHDPASTATIVGADGVTRTLTFASGTQAALAAPLLAGITASNALFTDTAGTYAMTASQNAVVDDASGGVAVTGNAAPNETIAAGAGAFNFTAGAGNGTVIVGSGNDSLYFPGGGNWLAALGNGADTVVAAAGNDSVATGNAGSYVFLGAGASSVLSAGADTILGGTGSSTVQASGYNSDELFSLGAPVVFIAGAGASTVVSGQVFTAIVGGGSGGSLAFTDGSTNYAGGGATDTVVGLAGSMTVHGGAGGGLFFGGTAGNNIITAGTGNTTAFGGGAGDVLTATGSASDLFAGGAGAETLTGAGSTGANTFFAGFGPETLIGGGGSTALVAGAAADVMTAGSGVTLFLFVAGRTAGATDVVMGWNPNQDFVKLAGYAGSEASVVANATYTASGATIALSDGTHVTFQNVTHLSASSFT